nr:STAS/SEC14 domain-containing protein [Lewinella sp. IMCC34191]
MIDVDAWTAGKAWRDLKFDAAHASDFEGVAVIG